MGKTAWSALLFLILISFVVLPVVAAVEGKIALSSNRDGNYEIYLMNPDGTGQTRLTSDTATDVFSAWSPDNTKIAFASNRDGDDDEIYVMNADGTEQTRLTSNTIIDFDPAWSPDGMRIAFTSERDGNYEIYAMNPDGTGQTRLTNNTIYEGEPDWGLGPQARNVSPVSVFPYGYLPPGTPVTAVFTINVVGEYPSDEEEQFFTDLDHPNWTCTLLVNGIENHRPVEEGSSLSIPGFELSYRSSDVVFVRVTLNGDAPAVDSPLTNFTVVKLQSLDSNNDVVPGSVVIVEGQTTATHPPVTDFTNITPKTGTAPLVVFFRDISTNYPSAWNWSFGDGTWSNATWSNAGVRPLNPIHTYTPAGTYTVSLTTSNEMGSNTTTKIGYITVTNATTQIGVFRPSTGYWYFDSNIDGIVDKSFRYGGSTDRIIVGNWQGTGGDGIAIFRPSTGYWYFDYDLDGIVDKSFRYGGSTDRILVGNWQGTDSDGIAIFRPSTGYWYFDYDLDGIVDKSFRYGGSTDRILVGNWQGTDSDGIAIFRPSTGYWYFDYDLDGIVDKSFRYGGSTDRILVGNWQGTDSDGIAIFRPSTGYWYFDYDLDGIVDKSFRYGGYPDRIMAGDWNGDGSDGIAIFRPSNGYWYFDYDLDGIVDKSFRYGSNSDWIVIGTSAVIPPSSQGITRISPTYTVGNNVEMTIIGSDFQSACTLNLTKATGIVTTIIARNVRWNNATQITGWFTVPKGSTGIWNVVVTNPDGTLRYLENAFEVRSPPLQPSITITFNQNLTITPGTTVYIPVGGKVIWKNDDPLKPHGIAAVDAGGAQYFGGLTGVTIPYNTTYEVTFDTIGSFDYKTTWLPETTGRVFVTT